MTLAPYLSKSSVQTIPWLYAIVLFCSLFLLGLAVLKNLEERKEKKKMENELQEKRKREDKLQEEKNEELESLQRENDHKYLELLATCNGVSTYDSQDELHRFSVYFDVVNLSKYYDIHVASGDVNIGGRIKESNHIKSCTVVKKGEIKRIQFDDEINQKQREQMGKKTRINCEVTFSVEGKPVKKGYVFDTVFVC